MAKNINFLAAVSVVIITTFALPARAQDVLPRPEQSFKGHIGRTVGDSTKDFPQEIKAPKGAPNILLILTDDVGFGASSTFGGPVPTPTMDRLANEGLRYTQFHTTALCSPTRAALLTGRNHHTAATGAGGVQLQNANGVILQLSGPKVGAEVSAAVGGVTVRFK